MSRPRLRFDEKGCYYHAYNRIAGPKDDYLFGDIEKQKMFSLVKELSDYYTLQPLSFVAMSNHYHCVVFAPAKDVLISDQEVKARWMKRYGKKLKNGKVREPRWKNRLVMKRLRNNMRNISEFIGRLQWIFTMWFKRTRPAGKERRGVELVLGSWRYVPASARSKRWSRSSMMPRRWQRRRLVIRASNVRR